MKESEKEEEKERERERERGREEILHTANRSTIADPI